MGATEELKAMQDVVAALGPVDDDHAKSRVLRWVAEVLKVPLAGGPARVGPRSEMAKGAAVAPEEAGEYETVADLMAAAKASSMQDRALVVGYWLQVLKGEA